MSNDSENHKMSEKDIVLSYKKMALDDKKHPEIMKDKTMVQFLAYSLDHRDQIVVEAALQSIELLVKNPKNYSRLRTTFGVLEALKATHERQDLDPKLLKLAKGIYTDLEFPHSTYDPLGRNSFRPEEIRKRSSSKLYSFHVFGLNQDSRNDLESALVRIRGVVSVVLDVEHQRCTIRVVEKITPGIIINQISEKTKLQARLVVKNKLNQEMLVAVPEDNPSPSIEDCLPSYLPEEEPPVKEKALHPFDRIKASAAGLVSTATSFFQNSFYW